MAFLIEPRSYKLFEPKELGGYSPEEVVHIFEKYWASFLHEEFENTKVDIERLSNYLNRIITISSEKARSDRSEDNRFRKEKERSLKSLGLHKSQIEDIPNSTRCLSRRNSFLLEFASYVIYGDGDKTNSTMKFQSLNKAAIFISKILCLLGLDVHENKFGGEEINQKFLVQLSQLATPQEGFPIFDMLLEDRSKVISQSIRKTLKNYHPAQTPGYYNGFIASGRGEVRFLGNVTKTTNNS